MFTEADPLTVIEAPEVTIETPDETLTLLERGLARLMRPWGWVKGDLHRRRRNGNEFIDQFCVLGSLRLDDDGHYMPRFDTSEAEHYIGLAIDGDPEEIPAWNDTPARRKNEVVAAFQKAIRLRKGDLARR